MDACDDYIKDIINQWEQRKGKERKGRKFHIAIVSRIGGRTKVASRKFLPCWEGMASEVEDDAAVPGAPLVANGAADVRRRVRRRAAAALSFNFLFFFFLSRICFWLHL